MCVNAHCQAANLRISICPTLQAASFTNAQFCVSAELLGGDLTDNIICDIGMPVIHRLVFFFVARCRSERTLKSRPLIPTLFC